MKISISPASLFRCVSFAEANACRCNKDPAVFLARALLRYAGFVEAKHAAAVAVLHLLPLL
jgi:hypothetical protein